MPRASVVVSEQAGPVKDKTVKVMKTCRCYPQTVSPAFGGFSYHLASAPDQTAHSEGIEEAARMQTENRMTRIPTARLNEEMPLLIEAHPPLHNGASIKYITQLPNTAGAVICLFWQSSTTRVISYRRFPGK